MEQYQADEELLNDFANNNGIADEGIEFDVDDDRDYFVDECRARRIKPNGTVRFCVHSILF